MARVQNISDDPMDRPALGLFGVQPGEIVEVSRASDFEGIEGWRVTAKKKTAKKPDDPEPDETPDDTAPHDEEPSL